ncbi:MAG: FAD-dependent oxidoreductase [Myxococcales bacterium]|nr:FAD-dependent oxidoreductase [Myxococcales bacterium]
MSAEQTHVVVLGGGFAGVESAISLREHGFRVTLVSDRRYVWIYPISIWIPTGEIEPEQVQLSLAALREAHGFEVVVDPVVRLVPDAQRVELKSRTLDYDVLVLATGGSKLRPKGVEHTHTICGAPEQAVALRDRLRAVAAQGSGTIAFGFGGNPRDTSAVRGGPVFEVMFNVHHWLEKQGLRDQFRLVFFAPMAQPGKRMGEKALAAMDGMYARAKIETKVGVKIEGFDPSGVAFADGTRIDADLVVFTPAGSGHPLLAESGLPLNDAGYVRIEPSCQVVGQEAIYAIGDVAALEGPEWRAKQGHMAEVMARVATSHIAARADGDSSREAYGDHHSILCVMDTGDGAAYVMRDAKTERMVPLPVVGHWMKKAWGSYWKASKLKQIPRLPGM